MAIKYLLVLNSSGTVIFHRYFGTDGGSALSQNDYLHLASTFHGMQLLVNEVSPTKSSLPGEMVTLETSTFTLQSLTLPTKVQIFVTASLRTERLAEFLREVHVLYADYIMKNPFYELGMPIKCEIWEIYLKQAVEKYNRPTG